jgi:hypothetical protein
MDVPFKGAAGFGVSVGHLWERIFVDAALSLYSVHYGAVRTFQQGAPLDPNSQVGVPRSDADTGTILSFGPGIGYQLNLFESRHWIEAGRFGMSYVQYDDTTHSMVFHGGLVSMHAEVGYRLTDAVTLAPGVTYNMGFMSGPSPAVVIPPGGDQHDKFLPIQWWSWQLGLSVWL